MRNVATSIRNSAMQLTLMRGSVGCKFMVTRMIGREGTWKRKGFTWESKCQFDPRVEWGQTLQYNNPNNKHMGSPHLCQIVFDGSWQIGIGMVLYWERRGKWWVHSWLKHKIKQDKLKLTRFSTFVPNKKTILETWSHSWILWWKVMTLPSACEVVKPRGYIYGWLVISKPKCNPVEGSQQQNTTNLHRNQCAYWFYLIAATSGEFRCN